MTTARRALVVVDVQGDYLEGPLTIQFPPVHDALERILAALDVAGQAGLPVAVVQHENPADAALFAAGSPGWELHPALGARLDPAWKRITKRYASCFDETDLAEWLRAQEVDTVTLVGFMANNCILGTAAGAAPLGFRAEVLADATGAIDLANDAGAVSAQDLHATLMTLLDSNFAAVGDSATWSAAAASGVPLERSTLPASARQGARVFAAAAVS